MSLFGRIDDVNQVVEALADRYGLEEVADAAQIPVEDLQRWYRGGDHVRPAHESRLYGFCVNRGDEDLIEFPPPYRRVERDGEFDIGAQPPGYGDIEPILHRSQMRKKPTEIGGITVDFPFGISASILTVNSKSIDFYSNLGFDILTYKTVRSVERDVHPAPHWLFVDPNENVREKVSPPFDEAIVGVEDRDYWPDFPHKASMINSFGIPSAPPSYWQEDVERAKQCLHSGQVLIVSVTASPEGEDSERALIEDFVTVAQQAKAAGADIIEANYSCPNTRSGDPTGRLYEEPELSAKVSSAVTDAIGDTPFFVKISYLGRSDLEEFVYHNRDYVDGIVAINTISVPVESGEGEELFPGRREAGLSGSAIQPWSKEVIKNLVDIRGRDGREEDFDIIGVGGISTQEDVYDFLNLGADAVESCTAAYLNPLLASETRMRPKSVRRTDNKEKNGYSGSREPKKKGENTHTEKGDEKYASEEAKLAWSVKREVNRVAESLSDEEERPDLKPIRLEGEDRQRGLYVIYMAGTVGGSHREGVRLVPQRTLRILDELDISYRLTGDT